ncbi:unnamed protein product [Linum tenue]|uniref:F-box domain-containing protein n=1 Tax=Linum tenue TaxID=586396 RepID=A0AAV0PDQ3_9ROSI|nr:unnamed protein product [Linum tenue]
MTENGCSDWDVPLSSLFPPSASRKRRRICPQGNPPPPPHLFSKLVDDLVIEILIRLPNPRSPCRCKAVCKRWRSLVADPSFNHRFISHHQTRYQPASLFIPAHDPQCVLSFLPVPDEARPGLRVFDCFKDLLLCGFVKFTCELGRSYFVCNPFTKQWVALPLAPEKPVPSAGSGVGLVCQPRTGSSMQQLGDEPEPEPEPPFLYSEYRFRVVCLFQNGGNQILQLFCSESGKWTQVLIENYVKSPMSNALTWNGKLVWEQIDLSNYMKLSLAAYDPFRPYIPPESVHVPYALWTGLPLAKKNFSVSQGAFHIIVFQVESSRKSLSVWRLEEDGVHWTQQYEMVLKTTSSSLWGDYKLEHCYVLDLHPEKPEIVFFRYKESSAACIFSCNVRTGMGEPEFIAAGYLHIYDPCWRALQPRVSCWPTPIPRYEQLRGLYDGSYDCWVQNCSTTTLPSMIGNYFEFNFLPSLGSMTLCLFCLLTYFLT